MGGRNYLGKTVWVAALDRLRRSYAEGHRVVCSVSGGKDSGVCAELCRIAAEAEGCLPVDLVMRDEEIMFPGTFEYCERLHARPEFAMRWVIAHQPILTAFDRANPYWWVFDKQCPELWVRQPPDFAEEIPDLDIRSLVSPRYFPVSDEQELHAIVGMRVQESRNREMGLHSSKGYLTGRNQWKVRNSRPIFDWTDSDIWLAIRGEGWDYNSAYDVMHRLGIPRRDLRISPPTMNPAAGDVLRKVGATAWPDWWNRVVRRIPSIRTYAQFGKRAVQPIIRGGESWEQCFQRTCVDQAPEWIAERAQKVQARVVGSHMVHSSAPFPQTSKCYECGTIGSWRVLTQTMYQGDPFSQRVSLPYVDPEFFRPGAGRWEGPPSF